MNTYYRSDNNSSTEVTIGPAVIIFPTEPWPERETIALGPGQVAVRFVRDCGGARPDSLGIDVTSVYDTLAEAGLTLQELQTWK